MNGNLFDLTGDVALVTGASSGIGLAIAQRLAAHGAKVVLASNDAAACEEQSELLQSGGYDTAAVYCDLLQRDSVNDLIRASIARFGRIDVLVCNAGVQSPAGPIGNSTNEDWYSVMTVNLRSSLWLTSGVIPAMAERGRGSVVLMSSIAGLRGNKLLGLYSLSKAGIAALARNLAVEWGPHGVRVNAISPGVIRTPFAQGMLDNSALMERRIGLTPLRRVGEPHEISGVAVMLASAAGGFITGHNLVVDGGTTISDGN